MSTLYAPTMPNIDFEVRLPHRHARQQEAATHPAKRKTINAGRRGGKTTLAADVSVERFLAGQQVMYAAPVAKQTDEFWKKCKRYLADGIRSKRIHKDETRRTLVLGIGQISCQTAHNADTMRSGSADLLIFDEWAYMEYDAWDKVGAPMMLDSDGDALFISTPLRHNHHFQFYQRGIADGERWASFRFPSTDNPYLSRAAFEEMTSDMSEEAYRQEILAEFLENEGAVFRNLDACLNAPQGSPADHAGHRKIGGGDWGKQNDFTAVSVGCADCRIELALDRFNQIDYAYQRKRVAALLQRWGVQTFMPEQNSMGIPIVEEIQRDAEFNGIAIVPFDTTASSKPPLIENLALGFEKAEWQFLPDPVGRGELEAYERKVSPTTGRSSYSAPEGLHDDTIMARALMRWAATLTSAMADSPAQTSRLTRHADTYDGDGSRWKKF